MQKKSVRGIRILLCAVLCTGLLAAPARAARYGSSTITLSKIPAMFTVSLDDNNVFVKGALQDCEVSMERAETTEETIEGFMNGTDTEVLLFPAEYTVSDTPYYMYVFVTDGYTNTRSRLRSLNQEGAAYIFELIAGLYTEDEEPSYSAADIGQERYIYCDRLYLNSEGRATKLARDYYNVWNGDLLQIMVVYQERYADRAIQWTEAFLESWEDAE